MTEQGFSELAGKKVSNLLPTLSLSKHYTFPLTQSCQILAKNPTPSSSIESLKHFKNTDSVFQKVGFAKMGHASQILPVRMPRGIFKGKSERDRGFGGESKPLTRLMGRGFEGVRTTLPLASKMGVKMPFKDSESEGLMGMDINQGVEKEKPLECSVDEGWEYKRVEKPMAMCICYKGLWDNYYSANIIRKERMLC